MIFDCLGVGRKSARATLDLMEETGYKTVREFRKQIRTERMRGLLILSCSHGYFRPSPGEMGRKEARESLRFMEKKQRSAYLPMRQIRLFAEGNDAQISMDEVNDGEK